MKKYFSFKFSFLFSTLLLILISESGFAQLAVPFKVRYQSHVKGDMTIIANTIVNRTDSKSSTSEPYNDISEKAKLNDEFEMAYIDIDNDETTFSSSSAKLNLTTSTPKKLFMPVYIGQHYINMNPVSETKNGTTLLLITKEHPSMKSNLNYLENQTI